MFLSILVIHSPSCFWSVVLSRLFPLASSPFSSSNLLSDVQGILVWLKTSTWLILITQRRLDAELKALTWKRSLEWIGQLHVWSARCRSHMKLHNIIFEEMQTESRPITILLFLFSVHSSGNFQRSCSWNRIAVVFLNKLFQHGVLALGHMPTVELREFHAPSIIILLSTSLDQRCFFQPGWSCPRSLPNPSFRYF
jgi:hypothetical protein